MFSTQLGPVLDSPIFKNCFLTTRHNQMRCLDRYSCVVHCSMRYMLQSKALVVALARWWRSRLLTRDYCFFCCDQYHHDHCITTKSTPQPQEPSEFKRPVPCAVAPGRGLAPSKGAHYAVQKYPRIRPAPQLFHLPRPPDLTAPAATFVVLLGPAPGGRHEAFTITFLRPLS